MRSKGKVIYFTGGIALIVLVMGSICYTLFSQLRGMLAAHFHRSSLEQQSLDIAMHTREVHLALYKGLSWSSSGYDEKKVSALLATQGSAMDQVLADVRRLQGNWGQAVPQAAALQQALDSLGTYREWASQVVEMAAADSATATMLMGSAENAYQDLNRVLQTLIEQNQEERRQARTQTERSLQVLFRIMIAALVLVLISVASLAGFLHRTVTRPIRRVTSEMTGSADEVAADAGRVYAISQQLAASSSEQAAALEETSASIEEMYSMTRQNAENAQCAKQLADQARQSAEAGARDMQTMSEAMAAIKESSNNIARIIKTIDEIAFQTNILALNAAVEAARAGEAGMGFAVVAEQVRALAQRCTQAARETTLKIEDSMGCSERGVILNQKVANGLAEIVKRAREVDTLIADIAQASQQQSDGIAQLNSAIANMDKVTQSNAASAEESADAAEQLNLQAQALRATVAELVRLAGSSTKQPGENLSKPVPKPPVVLQKPGSPLSTAIQQLPGGRAMNRNTVSGKEHP